MVLKILECESIADFLGNPASSWLRLASTVRCAPPPGFAGYLRRHTSLSGGLAYRDYLPASFRCSLPLAGKAYWRYWQCHKTTKHRRLWFG
jgi:hypothetical protein